MIRRVLIAAILAAARRPRKGRGDDLTHFGLCAIYSGRIKEMWNPRSTVRRAVLWSTMPVSRRPS